MCRPWPLATAMQRLGFASLTASKLCRERDRVLAMVAARTVAPQTKLATTRWWRTTTLAEDFAVTDASEDDLCAAMDWLRQDTIEKKLVARRLGAAAWCSMTCPPATSARSRQQGLAYGVALG